MRQNRKMRLILKQFIKKKKKENIEYNKNNNDNSNNIINNNINNNNYNNINYNNNIRNDEEREREEFNRKRQQMIDEQKKKDAESTSWTCCEGFFS